jgi:hypothetical protein
MDHGMFVAPGDWPAEDRARIAGYGDYAAFASGDQWLGRARRNEPRLTVNYARALIRKTASYIFPEPVRFSIDPREMDDPDTAAHAERLLNGLLASLETGQLELDLAIESATLGDAAMKITWHAETGSPVIAAVHPGTLRAITAPDDPRRLLGIEQRYTLDRAQALELFGVDPGGRQGDRVEARETWSDRRWGVTLAGQPVRDEPNPYGWIPYVLIPNDPPTHRLWGSSDLDDLADLCRELNQRMSVLARVLELSGAPIAVLENVDSTEGIVVGPGATWELPEGAKAYLLDLLSGGGAGLHVQYIDLLYRALHDLSETPRTAFGDSGRTLSGAALEVEIQPLVQRVRRRRRRWDAAFRQRNARLLDLMERFGGESIGGIRHSTAVWPPILPSDHQIAARTAVLLTGQGITSKRTALVSLGCTDPDAELERIDQERRVAAYQEAM